MNGYNKACNIADKISWAFDKVFSLLTITLLGSIVIVIFAEIVLRRFDYSIPWSTEYPQICLPWIGFLGAAMAYRRKRHMGMDLLTHKLSRRANGTVDLLINISFAIFMFFILKNSLILAFTTGKGQKTSILEIPYTYLYSSLIVSSILFLIYAVSFIMSDVKVLLDKSKVED